MITQLSTKQSDRLIAGLEQALDHWRSLLASVPASMRPQIEAQFLQLLLGLLPGEWSQRQSPSPRLDGLYALLLPVLRGQKEPLHVLSEAAFMLSSMSSGSAAYGLDDDGAAIVLSPDERDALRENLRVDLQKWRELQECCPLAQQDQLLVAMTTVVTLRLAREIRGDIDPSTRFTQVYAVYVAALLGLIESSEAAELAVNVLEQPRDAFLTEIRPLLVELIDAGILDGL